MKLKTNNSQLYASTITTVISGLCLIFSISDFCCGQAMQKPSTENIAPLATLSGSGRGLPSVLDGIKQLYGTGEWIGGSPNAWYGWINYPSLELKWEMPRKINKVVLYDRPTEHEHMAACVLKFNDGSEVHVFAVPNDGSPKTVVFESRTVISMTLEVVDGIGENIGLSELEVYYDSTAQPETKPKKNFTDFVSYIDPTIETGRGRWFFRTPGSRPFGMVCASAYTRNKNQGGGGYNYNSTEILGFANIHAWIMSGINIMPITGEVNPNLGEKGWKSSFSHESEIMEPGYHRVYLDRYKTQVPNSKQILPTTRQGYDGKCPLALSKVLLSVPCRPEIRS